MSNQTDTVLFESLQKRLRPEDVAEMVQERIGDDLAQKEKNVLRQAAKGSLRNMGWAYSSMSTEFFKGQVQMAPQAEVASHLFEGVKTLSTSACMDPVQVEDFIREVSGQIHKTFGESRKLTKPERRALGLFKCSRWYNKRYRLLCRMEDKLKRMTRNDKKYLMSRVSKSSLAFKIPEDIFFSDPTGNTQALVGYMSARMNVRSVFTNGTQQRAFDNIAKMLLTRCESSKTTNWLAIAYLMPDKSVVSRLSETDKAKLLAVYWSVLWDASELLLDVYTGSSFDLQTMIVSRGTDSTTWNQAAGAWNKAREGWISLLYTLKMDDVVERFLPGKVMRLMAGDVAYWHQVSGGDVHPDTVVWAALPKPWEVLSGQTACTKAMVAEACQKAGVKPEGWFGPKLDREPVRFKPTPELVHGVEVASPDLAKALRKAGIFSGQCLKGPVPEHVTATDEHGFVISAYKPAPSVYDLNRLPDTSGQAQPGQNASASSEVISE